MNRLRAGNCKMVNPYGKQVYQIDLSPENVDGIVFWTKNIRPFLKYLPAVKRIGYPFIIQYTVTGYPRQLESYVVDPRLSIAAIQQIGRAYGPEIVVWRYDPIILSSLTTFEWHLSTFERFARSLAGATNEVVISFAQIYRKTQRNMDKAAEEQGFSWEEHKSEGIEVRRELVRHFVELARNQGIALSVCSQSTFLDIEGVREARCIDADRLERVSGKSLRNKTPQKGTRKECRCYASKDIGEYDTCPHGCVYCYAVQNREIALDRYRKHDPQGEFLFAPT